MPKTDKPKRNTKAEDEARLRRADLSDADQRVLDYRQWCALAGISFMTGKRLLAAGKGPRTVQLSAQRVGIRMIDHARWLEERLRSA